MVFNAFSLLLQILNLYPTLNLFFRQEAPYVLDFNRYLQVFHEIHEFCQDGKLQYLSKQGIYYIEFSYQLVT